MSDAEDTPPAQTAAAAAPKAQKKKTKSKSKSSADHPQYRLMIKSALTELKERTGSSRQAILKYIVKTFNVGDEKTANNHLKLALRAGVKNGTLKQSKGTGASGSFKLGEAKDSKTKKEKPKTTSKPKKSAQKTEKKTKKVKKPKAEKKAKSKPVKKVKAAKKSKSPAKKSTKAKKSKSPKKAAKKD